jgi:hypothetical protein
MVLVGSGAGWSGSAGSVGLGAGGVGGNGGGRGVVHDGQGSGLGSFRLQSQPHPKKQNKTIGKEEKTTNLIIAPLNKLDNTYRFNTYP